MTGVSWIPVAFVALMTAATILLGVYATRKAKTASDFFVAGRSVSVFWNASAISGEYLSAASFMGIAGLLMKNGYDALWYPVCYATGYLFLLLFIAGPLRRFGAYTIPDFAEGRFDSPTFRKVAVTFVLFIGFFYTMPQMKGAGVVMGSILNWPYWAGIVIVGVVITFNVAFGGMKGITFVQAFQYWAKLFAIAVPFFVLSAVLGGYPDSLSQIKDNPDGWPRLVSGLTYRIKGAKDYPLNVLACSPVGATSLILPNGAAIDRLSPVRKPEPGEDPVSGLLVIQENRAPGLEPTTGLIRRATNPGYLFADERIRDLRLPAGAWVVAPEKCAVTRGGVPVLSGGKPVTTTARIEFKEPTAFKVEYNGGTPNGSRNDRWIRPFGPLTSKHGHPLLYTYSLIIALICGTAGLPHILVRFYTNPDGRSAKRTTLWVMVMLGCFYVFPPAWGTLGRYGLPEALRHQCHGRRRDPATDHARKPALGPGPQRDHQRGSIRGVHVNVLGPAREHVGGPGPRHLRQDSPAERFVRIEAGRLQGRGRPDRRGVDGTRAAGRDVRHRHDGRMGVRHRRLLLLPLAPARLVVEGPDQGRRGGRDAHRWISLALGHRLDDADRQEGDSPRRLAAGPLAAGATGDLGRAALAEPDGRALEADAGADPAGHPPQDAPAARPRRAGPLEELH